MFQRHRHKASVVHCPIFQQNGENRVAAELIRASSMSGSNVMAQISCRLPIVAAIGIFG